MTPPSLPPQQPPQVPPANEPVVLDLEEEVRGIAGAEGLTHRQLLEEVARGGRLMVFPYVISVILITFRRASDVHLIRVEGSPAGGAAKRALITLLAGWWGFPWGPIYSVAALFQNAMGGKDVTEAILGAVMGAEQAKAAIKFRPRVPAGAGLWALRGGLLALVALIVSPFYFIAAESARKTAEFQKMPGYSRWHDLESHLGGRADGNSPEARAAAAGIKKVLDGALTISGKGGKKRDPKPFGVWCELRPNDAVVLVQCGDWSKLSSSVEKELCEAIWSLSCEAAGSESGRGVTSALLVGVKGAYSMERTMSGKLGDSHPPRTLRGDDGIPLLIEGFAKSIQ